jgi:5-methylcytosine-specific restriction endonuclease McrA
MQFQQYITDWKLGKKGGNRGQKIRLISKHVRRYVLEKYKFKCSLCGWSKTHPVTGHSPLEINHIDGNPLHTTEANLQLLCPNCHSLTDTYRNLNRGNGRAGRSK